MGPQSTSPERIPGGRAAHRLPINIDPWQIQRGVQVELEHTRDPRLAYEIALDHLGGAGVVADRAHARLEAGAPLEAIHLAEVALTADPGHRGALEISLRAHEHLEKQSENFWLTSWLRRQSKTLRERLAQAPLAEIRIADLAAPELNDVQRSALQMAERLKVDFSEEHILAQARARTGLSDFGADDFRQRLRVLAEDWGGDDGLTMLGRLGLQQSLVRYATNRLLIHDS